jgi:hypothetical protein
VSLKPEQLQRVCYDAVKKDFFVERVLGGVGERMGGGGGRGEGEERVMQGGDSRERRWREGGLQRHQCMHFASRGVYVNLMIARV